MPEPPTPFADAELVEVLLRGEADPRFAAAWEQFSMMVKDLAHRVYRGPEGADRDTFVEDAVLHVWINLGTFQQGRPLRPWVAKVVSNYWKTRLKQLIRRRELEMSIDEVNAPEPSSRTQLVLSEVAAKDDWSCLARMLRVELDQVAPVLDAKRRKVDFHAILLLLLREDVAALLRQHVTDSAAVAVQLVPWHDRELLRRPTPQQPRLACIWGNYVLGPPGASLAQCIAGDGTGTENALLRQWRRRCRNNAWDVASRDGVVRKLLQKRSREGSEGTP